MTHESPVGKLPRTYPVWPHGLAKAEGEEGKAAEAAKLAAFTPDEYQSRMSKWMFRNMAEKQTATIDDDTARYLETLAWETWQDVNRRLSTATAP
jgi:hypothetical protein